MAMATAAVLLTGVSEVPAQTENTLISQRFSGTVEFFVDIASYKYPADPASGTFVEIYYTLDRSQMEFIELEDGVLSAIWQIQTVIETEVGDTVHFNFWRTVSQDTSRTGAQATRDTYDIYSPPLLTPGVYKFITTITDLNSQLGGNTRIGVDERVVIIPEFTSPELTISDIEFAVRLGRASSPNQFVKNGLQVLPNPLRVYGVNVAVLSFYAEVYGLSPAGPEAAQPNTYTRRVTVEGLNVDYRREVEVNQRPIRSANEIIALSGINAAVFPRGDYRLILEVVDDATGVRTVRTKTFRVVTNIATVLEDEIRTAPMNQGNIQRFRDEIEILASADQLREYDARPAEGKREFLISFWAGLDETPGTPQNEFRIEFLERFKYANDNFATRTQPAGSRTDQGRVWILFGRPDDTIPHPDDSQGGKAWVEWIYNQVEEVGRGRFIFGDTTGGFGSYRLIHSNVPGQPHNTNWKVELGVTDPNIPPVASTATG